MTDETESAANAGVELYSTNFLRNMLEPRSVERRGKKEPVIHHSTGTARPPVCYVAWSDYQALERAKTSADTEVARLRALLGPAILS
jgi:hypothetical protein